MDSTPSPSYTTATWRHVVTGAAVRGDDGGHGQHNVCPGGVDPVSIGSILAKPFTTTTKGRPTRRGAPPH